MLLLTGLNGNVQFMRFDTIHIKLFHIKLPYCKTTDRAYYNLFKSFKRP